MEQYTQSIIAMLAVINPVVCGAMLIEIQKGKDLNTNIKAAFKAMSIVLIILVLSALGGKHILNIFGISMEAFKIVGGVIIGFIGIQMMFELNNKSNSEANEGDLSRLVMFAASPGTIAMVITLAAIHKVEGIPITAILGTIIAIAISLAIVILMLFLATKKNTKGQGFITKFMGLIIVGMGLQFMLDGIKDFFNI